MTNDTIETARHEGAKWNVGYTITKYDVTALEDLAPAEVLAGMSAEEQLNLLLAEGLDPYEVVDRHGNLLMYGGVSLIWEAIKGTTLTGALQPFSNANATIGVGDSTTAAAATQTDLQASTNKLRKAMDATFPTHTDGTTSGAAQIVFQSTFGTADANFAWQEWGIFNNSAGGRMLNRKVESNGTKASGTSWQFALTISIA